MGPRTYVSKAPDIKGRGNGSRRSSSFAIFHLIWESWEQRGSRFFKITVNLWHLGTHFPRLSAYCSFLYKEKKEFLEQLVTEKNSKIKIKHLYKKVSQWKNGILFV